MSINPDTFTEFFTLLTDRFRQDYSHVTIREWFSFLDGKLSTEEFIEVARYFFRSDAKFMPTPKELVDHVEVRRPSQVFNALEAVKEKAFADMTHEEQQAHLAAIAKARAMLKNIGGMNPIGKSLDTSAWAEDPILSKELRSHSDH